MIRSSIHYRYRLIPFLYNLLVNFHRTGQPVLRPIVYHCQDDPETHQQSFEFMVGESLMVAPVYEPNVTQRTVYLPKTYNWYHLQTGKYYTGGQKVDIDAPLDAEAAPAFVRESSLIPLGKTMQHVGFSADDERVIEVWPSHASSGKVEHKQLLVEDDGISTKHTDAKEYTELEISMRSTEKTITLDINIVHQNFKPAYNTLSFVLKSADDDRDIVFAQEGSSQFKVHQKSKGTFTIDMPWK